MRTFSRSAVLMDKHTDREPWQSASRRISRMSIRRRRRKSIRKLAPGRRNRRQPRATLRFKGARRSGRTSKGITRYLRVSAPRLRFSPEPGESVPHQHDQQAIADLFARHMDAEFTGDLETTLAAMTDNPHLVNVPSMAGGAGREEVRAFYAGHLAGKFLPPDVEFTEVSRTFGNRRLVDELIVSFTRTQEIEWMLPGVAPTGRPVRV